MPRRRRLAVLAGSGHPGRLRGLSGRGTGHAIEQPGQACPEASGGPLRLAGRHADQVLCGVKRERSAVARERQRLVCYLVEFLVLLVQGQDRGTEPPGVVRPLKQRDWCYVRADHEERLAAPRRLQAGQPDAEMRWRTRRRLPSDQGWREPGQVGQPAFLVQVRGQVPWFFIGGTHYEQPAGCPGRPAKGVRKGPGSLQPVARAEQLAKRSHLIGVHLSHGARPGHPAQQDG